jgi:hypothetical protein
LRDCLVQLEARSALLSRCRERIGAASGSGPAGEGGASGSSRADGAAAAGNGDAGVSPAWPVPAEDELRRALAWSAERRREERARRASAARELVTSVLRLTSVEWDWLAEFVCAVRELRGAALTAPADGGDGSGSAEAWEELRARREAVLADIEKYLGPDRYRRLREAGGIGLLGDVVDCGE